MNKKLLSVLVKPVSADCNMRCHYCFYRRPLDPYKNEKDADGRIFHRMSEDVLGTFISQCLQSAGAGFGFSWQGGEPMLAGIQFYKKVVELEIKYARMGMEIGNAMQTNALLITEEWARFFSEYKFLVGVSIDGPADLHNIYRGKGTQEQVMESIRILKAHGVVFNTLTVVNNLTAEKPEELVDFFVSNDIFHLQFIPCVERDYASDEITPFSVKPEQYGRFLCRLFDKWYNRGRPYFSVRDFDNVLMAYLGMEPELCQMRKECGSYAVIEYNGDVYPCDFFVLKEWKMGNIMEKPLTEIINGEVASRFNAIKPADISHGALWAAECKNCKWVFVCNRGCPRYRINHNGEIGKNYFCDAYREFFSYAHKRFESLASQLKSSDKSPPVL